MSNINGHAIPLATTPSPQAERHGGGQNQYAAPSSNDASFPRPKYKTSLKKGLKERHVSMITWSATLGIGLFLQCGHIIYLAGPGMAVVCYLLARSVKGSMIACLGEMTALFPVQGPIFEFACRFLDQSIGFAAAWMVWFSWSVIIASEILAVAQLWNFQFDSSYLSSVGYPDSTLEWPVGQNYTAGVWVGIFMVAILVANLLPVKWYGRMEYFFGCIKMCFIVGLILFNTVINSMKIVPHGSRFWTYDDPWSFITQNYTISEDPTGHGEGVIIDGSPGRLAGTWSALTSTIFSLIGFELVAITAAENKDLEKTESIKLAVRKITLRVLLLYSLACFTVGLNVPYTDSNLRDYAFNSIRSGQHSIFILAAVRNHLRGWPSFFNGFFIFSATVSGMNSIYNASRVLHALACIREAWPRWAEFIRWRLSRTKAGVPMGAVFASWCFGLLAFLATSDRPAQVLGRMATNSVVSMVIVYCTVCAAYIVFYHVIGEAARGRNPDVHLALQGHFDREDRERYPYRSRGQWLRAVYALTGCGIILLFNGWRSFVSPFSVEDFLAAYISIPVFFLLVVLYHFKLQGGIGNWRLAPTMNLRNPLQVEAPEHGKRRRGRWPKLHKVWTEQPVRPNQGRQDQQPRFDSGNLRKNISLILEWGWAWLK